MSATNEEIQERPGLVGTARYEHRSAVTFDDSTMVILVRDRDRSRNLWGWHVIISAPPHADVRALAASEREYAARAAFVAAVGALEATGRKVVYRMAEK